MPLYYVVCKSITTTYIPVELLGPCYKTGRTVVSVLTDISIIFLNKFKKILKKEVN